MDRHVLGSARAQPGVSPGLPASTSLASRSEVDAVWQRRLGRFALAVLLVCVVLPALFALAWAGGWRPRLPYDQPLAVLALLVILGGPLATTFLTIGLGCMLPDRLRRSRDSSAARESFVIQAGTLALAAAGEAVLWKASGRHENCEPVRFVAGTRPILVAAITAACAAAVTLPILERRTGADWQWALLRALPFALLALGLGLFWVFSDFCLSFD